MDMFLRGALAMACWVAGLFFLRFWRDTRDRLFLFFLVAFWLFSAHWVVLAQADINAENKVYVYMIRLVVFGLIAAGVVDRNTQSSNG